MRKFLLILFGITTIFNFNKVNAAEFKLEYDTNINEINSFISLIGSDKVFDQVNELINLYNSDYASNYPYYFISLGDGLINSKHFTIYLHCLSNLPYSEFSSSLDGFGLFLNLGSDYIEITRTYDFETNLFDELISINSGRPPLLFLVSDEKYYSPYAYYYSNFDFYYDGAIYTNQYNQYPELPIKPSDNLLISSFEDSNIYSVNSVGSKFLIEPYYLYDNNTSLEDNKYTTIDLNQYSYVIASLKDYSLRDTFTTTMYVKGQLCATTVYNYGTEEKKDYVSGWQTPDCGTYFNEYTRHLNFIREEDIKNHAVYYLSALDFSKPNLVKLDSSIYNIAYITSENEDIPSVSIGGTNYQILPYSSLTDSAILTEKNGINDTWTCAKYDTDCFLDSSGINIDGLFSNPLETLKSIWGAITSIFELITDFISLLPPVMQAFLYLAFGVGIALGIIKLIL